MNWIGLLILPFLGTMGAQFLLSRNSEGFTRACGIAGGTLAVLATWILVTKYATVDSITLAMSIALVSTLGWCAMASFRSRRRGNILRGLAWSTVAVSWIAFLMKPTFFAEGTGSTILIGAILTAIILAVAGWQRRYRRHGARKR